MMTTRKMSNRSRLRPALALGVALLLLVPRMAQTQPQRRVALLRLSVAGKIPEVARGALSERLVAGLAGLGFQVFAGSVVDRAINKPPALGACRDPACYRKLANRLDTEYLVTGGVRESERNYELSIELRSRAGGEVLAQESDRCELCGIQEVGAKLEGLVSSLAAKIQMPAAVPLRVSVDSRPAGQVMVDGQVRGSTPVQFDLGSEGNDLVVWAPGHRPEYRRVTAAGAVSFDLVRDGSPAQTSGPAQSGDGDSATLRKVGIASLASGVVLMAAGTLVLAFLNGQVVACPPEQLGMTCHRDSHLPAGVLIGGGAVAALGGGLVLILGRDGDTRRPAAGATAWVFSARGSF